MSNETLKNDLEACLSEPFPSSAKEAASRIVNVLDRTIEVCKTNEQSVSSFLEPVIWDDSRVKDSSYTFINGQSDITILPGRYRIFLQLTTKYHPETPDSLSGSKIEIQEDSYGEFKPIKSSESYGHHGIAPTDYFTLISMCTFVAASLTKIRTVTQKLSGTDELKIEPEGSNMLIKRL